MENKNKITIIGVPASPYTRKMLSALRYRNIQHSVIWGNAKEILNSMGLETPKPTLLPVVLLHNGSEVTAICDTTPIIRKLEVNNSDRGIIPKNKSLALLNSILEDFGLVNRKNNLPSELSGGEQQRVAIARAISFDPEIILADEPTGNLDRKNTELVSNLLLEYSRKKKICLILVTHNMNLARKCDRVMKLVDGQIKS